MSERDTALAALLARARVQGKRVFWYTTEYASCAELVAKAKLPDEADRICVEGDAMWGYLPAVEKSAKGAA